MISREQFEALVRAEAERRWPMPDDEPDFTSLDRQTAYIDARMEHEWPLVEAGNTMLSLLSMRLPVDGLECSDCRYDFGKGHNAGCDVPRIEKAVAAWNELLSPLHHQTNRAMSKECSCERCRDERDEGRVDIGGGVFYQRDMIVCEVCGNKRCPKATDHRNECTNSNEPGQKGSSWENYKLP